MLDRFNTVEAFEDYLNSLVGIEIEKEFGADGGVTFILEGQSKQYPQFRYVRYYMFDSEGDKILKVYSLVNSEGILVRELKREQYKRGFNGLAASSTWGKEVDSL